MRAFIISLERSYERRLNMQARLTGTPLQFAFFAAIDGNILRREDHAHSSGLTGAELGCYLSHLAVWRHVAASDLPCALVLEDDVVLAPDIIPVCAELAQLPLLPDIVRLSSSKKPVGTPMFTLLSRRQLLLPTGHPSGTQAYWLTRRGAQRLLDALSMPTLPIDKALDRYWRHDLHVLLANPPAAWEPPGTVSIIGSRDDRSLRSPHKPGRVARNIEKWQRRFAVRRLERRLKRQLDQGALDTIGTDPRPAE